jgi:two-component system heavy metal sensor histidine kinase CusS
MRVFPPAWPIAWRLAVMYALSLFLLLAIAAGFLDWTLTSEMKRDNNEFLAVEMQSLRTLLKQRPGDVQAWREEIEREAAGSRRPRYYVRILDEQGAIIVEMPGMNTAIGPHSFPPPIPMNSKKVNPTNAIGADGRPFVVASQWVKLYRSEDKKRLIQIALDTSHDEETIADYRKKALLVLLLGVLVSATLGFLIAKAGLQPLAKLTQVFTRVTPEHLNERLGSISWPPEIASAANAFDSMLQRLERSFALLSQFSGDLAHELRTPITNLRGEAEVSLGRARTAEEYRRVIESSLEEYERLSRVIDNLLFLARTDTRNTVVRFSQVNVRMEIDAIMEYFEALAEEKNIKISLSGNALLNADAVLFRRALTNLLSNAFQYTDANGSVAIAVATHDGRVRVGVADSGIGIEKIHLEKVLNRFFRTEKARAMNSQGNGLGLAIVKSIMDLHGGTVDIESIPGQGTTVHLNFPQPQNQSKITNLSS